YPRKGTIWTRPSLHNRRHASLTGVRLLWYRLQSSASETEDPGARTHMTTSSFISAYTRLASVIQASIYRVYTNRTSLCHIRGPVNENTWGENLINSKAPMLALSRLWLF